MTREDCIVRTLVARLGVPEAVLPQEEAVVTVMFVIGWLVVPRGVVPVTVCGRNNRRNKAETLNKTG